MGLYCCTRSPPLISGWFSYILLLDSNVVKKRKRPSSKGLSPHYPLRPLQSSTQSPPPSLRFRAGERDFHFHGEQQPWGRGWQRQTGASSGRPVTQNKFPHCPALSHECPDNWFSKLGKRDKTLFLSHKNAKLLNTEAEVIEKPHKLWRKLFHMNISTADKSK